MPEFTRMICLIGGPNAQNQFADVDGGARSTSRNRGHGTGAKIDSAVGAFTLRTPFRAHNDENVEVQDQVRWGSRGEENAGGKQRR